MRVDAHQHFWRYSKEEFSWINDAMAAIRRDFLPADLRSVVEPCKVDATVAVQADQSLKETRWLLELAAADDLIAGVVGWVPLVEDGIDATLEKLSAHTRLRGVRHVLQAEPDAFMEQPEFDRGIAALKRHALTYDLLVLEHQLPTATRLVDRHPEQPFVLDHLAKPLIAAGELEPWRTRIRELADRPHVCCKVSGMVTEADFQRWVVADLRPYLDTVLECFGPSRLMFGSDWPVCTVAASYAQWMDVIEQWIAPLSPDEQSAILGRNADRFYNLNLTSEGSEASA